MFEIDQPKPKYRLVYPKSLGISKKDVLRERNKLHNPDIWDFEETKNAYILKFNKTKARRKLRNGTFRSAYRHEGNLDFGEPKGFYYGTKEKKQSGFGQIDFDFGLKL